MALVSRRRFPIVDDPIIANTATTVRFVRNATFGFYGDKCKMDNRSIHSNEGLLALRYRNSIKTEYYPTIVNIWDEKEIGCGGYGVVWVVSDPRYVGKRVALKKMANVFRSLGHSKRAYRELRMLCALKHENILTCCDILEPNEPFEDVFVVTELMETDLQRVIVSAQPLSPDHIKIFMYQLLRGMKYLHSANVLHRDLKPSNLLVNSNCLLKICDFGLARIWDDENHDGLSLTQEVVTEYYRAPELLMGALRYNASTDVWSIGCIFAELLSRRILFESSGPLEQLDIIIDLLGSPTWMQMKYACDEAKQYVFQTVYRPCNINKLYSLGSNASVDAVDLLVQLLKFDPDERTTTEDAIDHPYLQDARLVYHTCMCSCCDKMEKARLLMQKNTIGIWKRRLEPKQSDKLDDTWEKELNNWSIQEIRRRVYNFIMTRLPFFGPVLALNSNSVFYEEFMASTEILQLDPVKGDSCRK